MAFSRQLTSFYLMLATLLFSAATTSLAISPPPQPADHLVPPPAPLRPQKQQQQQQQLHLPIAQRLTHAGFSAPAPAPAPAPSGFMTRVARWFGLGGGGAAASLPRDQQLSTSSHNYAYPKPAQHFDAAGKPCGLCNKYPWVPMMGQQLQQQQLPYQQQQQQQVLAWQQPVGQASQQRQRAVQFHAPSLQAAQSVFLPISVTRGLMTHVAMPPLYNPQPFRPLENVVGAHSELRPVPIVPTTQSPQPFKPVPNSSSFEIVQSHQVTDFVTSVEYPATFVQSHNIELDKTINHHHHHPQQQQSEPVPPPPSPSLEDISTVRYQLEDLSSGAVHQHLPASQLLTELGHLEAQTTVLPPADNYPAASSQQQQQQQQEDEEQEQHLYYAEQYQELASEPSTTVETPIYTTELATPATAVELNNHLMLPIHTRDARQRNTPKRLLDSPINHVQSGARPFTRDPADLHIRPMQPTQPTEEPTPTSTYGAIDASGQFAGMSPPGPQQVIIPYTTKQKPRPFEPAKWTTNWLGLRPAYDHQQKQQDNDVELHEQQESKLVSTATAAPLPPNTRRTTKYLTKILASNLRELLKRERETKRRPTMPHFGVDISKLQHNIDGWTEQEYNSLSHRPSTPTIRGRSKHIPSEYLTTTTPATPTASRSVVNRQSKTTRGGFELGGGGSTALNAGGDLSTSINNLEQLHLKRFQPVDDNRLLLLDYYDSQHHRHQPTTTPITPATPTTTTSTIIPSTTMATVTPLYVRSTIAQTPAPMELWKQAKVAILPQTNEKVYVVTPQPRHQHQHHHQQHHGELAASASMPEPVYQMPAARFPNARMRPTPASLVSDVESAASVELMAAATPTPATEQLRNYTPDIFGLMGLSAYVPAEPVEIIDGNSKVNTIVTSAPSAAALQRFTTRPTIPPRPR